MNILILLLSAGATGLLIRLYLKSQPRNRVGVYRVEDIMAESQTKMQSFDRSFWREVCDE